MSLRGGSLSLPSLKLIRLERKSYEKDLHINISSSVITYVDGEYRMPEKADCY